MKYGQQVGKEHYARGSYRLQDRWNSYWHQMDLVQDTSPHTVLEIGMGGGTVTRELRASGISVTTVDIAEDLHPDVVGSVTALPFANDSFDTVLAAEILEHIRFEDVPTALREISRVARASAIISVPHPGYVFSLSFKLPLLHKVSLFGKVPFFWESHRFDGEHYWELGKRGYSVSSFIAMATVAGLVLVASFVYPDDPAHRFFLFSKRP